MRGNITQALTLVVAGALFVPTAATAAVITVPTDQPTIADALDVVSPGDTIRINSGTYPERIRIRRLDGLSVEGVDTGGGQPIIQPSVGNDAVRIRESVGVTITGLQLVGGQRGVRIDDDAPNATIVGNVISGSETGIRVKKAAGAIVMGNMISNITKGRGIRVDKAAGVQIDSNDISGTAREGIRATKSADIAITANNILMSARAAIRIVRCDNAVIGDALLGGNTASDNGRSGIRMKRGVGVTISNNVADNNGRYGFRVDRVVGIDGVSDLLGMGNTAMNNVTADMRVNNEKVGGTGGSTSTTSSTSSTTTTTLSTTTSTSTTTTTLL